MAHGIQAQSGLAPKKLTTTPWMANHAADELDPH